MTAQDIQHREAVTASQQEAAFVAAYSRRRVWSRTDTGRWLNDRSEPLLAWLRRRSAQAPIHSRQVGYWLREFQRPLFDRAHARLAPLTDDAREKLFLDDLFK